MQQPTVTLAIPFHLRCKLVIPLLLLYLGTFNLQGAYLHMLLKNVGPQIDFLYICHVNAPHIIQLRCDTPKVCAIGLNLILLHVQTFFHPFNHILPSNIFCGLFLSLVKSLVN